MIIIREIDSSDKKSSIANSILRALPEWFGIEESIVDYIEQVKEIPLLVALDGEKEVGFLAIKLHNPFSAEICVMGVLKEYHGQGIGKMLLEACEEYCYKKKIEFLTVKTLAESHPDENYAKTRKFYMKSGFKPLEVFPLLWDESNPCLFMVKKVELLEK